MRISIQKLKQFLIFLLAITIVACNGSKAYTKKAARLAAAGIHKEAIEYYIQALNRDRSNVEAQIGLRKSGEEVMSKYQSKFFKEYNSSNYKSAVYTYIEIEDFKKKIDAYNADVNVPSHLTEDYQNAKKEYLEEEFEMANKLMSEEQFEAAEAVFVEIQKIEPNYKGADLQKLKEIAQLEPPYRRGNSFLDLGKNRSAYYEFKKVTDKNSAYKDAKFKLEEALDLSEYPVAVLKFKNYSGDIGGAAIVEANIINDLLAKKGPFLKVLDRTHMDKVLNEQYLAMNGWMEGNGAVKTGELLGAKAILSGKLLSVKSQIRSPQLKREKAYKRRVEKYFNNVTQKTESKYVYDKIYYNNYKGHTQVSISFQYILVSTETGEILDSGIEEKVIRSEVNYNTYSGNYKNLYPGTWNLKLQNSTNDRVYTNRSKVNNFRQTFTASKNMKGTSELRMDGLKSIGSSVAAKVYLFNPEK
jgi:tetratricopeptide (TPR) repeat protein